jgi:hypothetical protein
MTSVLNLHDLDKMINECEGVGDMRIIRRNRSARIKPAPMPLYEPQIYYYYLFKLQMCFYPVAVYYNKTQHTNNTHHNYNTQQTNTAHKTTRTIKDTQCKYNYNYN